MNIRFVSLVLVFSLLSLLFVTSLCQTGACGPQGPFCQQGLCCSIWGYCGSTSGYCSPGQCQSQCPDSPPLSPPPPPPPVAPSPPPPPPSPPSPPGTGDLTSLITKEMFEEMLKNRNNPLCTPGFYTYESFIAATNLYPEFGNVGDTVTRKREIAAFFGQTSHETTGGWDGAPNGGQFAWGYCFKEELAKADYCEPSSTQWPCVPGKQYFGRGPMQLTWNYNYGQFGDYLGVNLLSNPDLVASDATIAFEAALWFWMTPQAPKPSCHDVIVGKWIPLQCDISANRLPGLGVTTNIINGGLECAGRNPTQVQSRISFYIRYCDIFGISYGENLDCANQIPFSETWCTYPGSHPLLASS